MSSLRAKFYYILLEIYDSVSKKSVIRDRNLIHAIFSLFRKNSLRSKCLLCFSLTILRKTDLLLFYFFIIIEENKCQSTFKSHIKIYAQSKSFKQPVLGDILQIFGIAAEHFFFFFFKFS